MWPLLLNYSRLLPNSTWVLGFCIRDFTRERQPSPQHLLVAGLWLDTGHLPLLRSLSCQVVKSYEASCSRSTLLPPSPISPSQASSCLRPPRPRHQVLRPRTSILEAALSEYQKKTGSELLEHPLAAEIKRCDSIGAISALLQGQAREFQQFRNGEIGRAHV